MDKESVRPHPDKIKAITEIPEPKNQAELCSFLGMVNYYDRFVPDLATTCVPLNSLLQKNTQWTSQHVEAVTAVKKLLTSADTLSHYDPSVPISLSCDASPVGIETVIFHSFPDDTKMPIAYASCKLTAAEHNYAKFRKKLWELCLAYSSFVSTYWDKNSN